ncbi:MAG: L-seryl-tRNA(Sec) selenium transferase, partial [Afipia sp.]|nr:L-seryl-tRNA(Sec) selenium transferase [Afipia sp.]
MEPATATLSRIPSVDEILKTSAAQQTVARFGRPRVVEAIRRATAAARHAMSGGETAAPGADTMAADALAADAIAWLEADARPNARAVFNLTGTVLHTNLGRAILAEAAVEAATVAMREALALEFDLA